MIATIQVLVIALLIAVGYFLAKKEVFTEKTGKELSYLLFNIVTPCLILHSFQIELTRERMKNFLIAIGLAALSYALVIVLSYLYCGRGEENKVERLSLIFSNAGFMGIPLIAGMYGDEGIFYASLMVIVFNILFWSYGIAVIRGHFSRENIRQIVLSPTILSVVAGLLLAVCRIQIPEPLYSATKHLANLNTPLAMLVAGVSIAQSDLLSVFKNSRLYKVIFGKLFLAPLVVALVFALIPAPRFIKEIIVIQVACPVAALISISIMQCDGDSKTATEYFTLSTLASVASIPVIKIICEFLFR